jgi:hypothetical protein
MSSTSTTVLNSIKPGECLVLGEFETRTGIPRASVTRFAARLVVRGYFKRLERGCFQLTEAGIEAQQKGIVITSGPYHPQKKQKITLRDRVWRAVRFARQSGSKFTTADILSVVQDEIGNSENRAYENVSLYLRGLKKCGVIRELPGHKNRFKRYQVLRDPGPEAPIYRLAKKEIFDPNSGEVLPCVG